jgi:hypothetical protein
MPSDTALLPIIGVEQSLISFLFRLGNNLTAESGEPCDRSYGALSMSSPAASAHITERMWRVTGTSCAKTAIQGIAGVNTR